MANRKYTDQRLKEAIDAVLKSAGMADRYYEIETVRLFQEFVGEVIWKHVTKAFVRDKCLHVYFDSAVLREEVYMQRSKIIGHIAEHFGKPMIERLDVK